MGQLKDCVARFGSLVILITVLAACGNADEDTELPTRIQLPLDTPTTVADVPATLTIPIASPSPTAPAPTESTETLAPSPSPTTDPLSQIPPGAEIDTDYSELAPGQTALLYGELTLRTIDGTDEQIALMIDDQGTEIEVMLPPGFMETLLGRPIDIAGVVVAAEVSPSGRLAIQPNAIDTFTSVADDGQSEGTTFPETTTNPPTADAEALAALLTPIPGAERRLDIQISAGLSALATYDELFPLISSSIGNLPWVAMRGSPDTGWWIDFWDEDAALISTYRVDDEGQVHVSSQLSLPGATYYPIQRATINTEIDKLVDEDPLVDATEGPLSYRLEATDEETAVWTVLREDAVVAMYDAYRPSE